MTTVETTDAGRQLEMFDELLEAAENMMSVIRPQDETMPEYQSLQDVVARAKAADLASQTNQEASPMTRQAAPVLGPFQAIWDAWEPYYDRIMAQPPSHFPTLIEMQVEEWRAGAPHLDAQVKEIIDIISVCLNWLRWHRLTPEAIAGIAVARAANRYVDGDANMPQMLHLGQGIHLIHELRKLG